MFDYRRYWKERLFPRLQRGFRAPQKRSRYGLLKPRRLMLEPCEQRVLLSVANPIVEVLPLGNQYNSSTHVYSWSWGTPGVVHPGDTLYTAVDVTDHPEQLESEDIRVTFDSTQLTASSVSPSAQVVYNDGASNYVLAPGTGNPDLTWSSPTFATSSGTATLSQYAFDPIGYIYDGGPNGGYDNTPNYVAPLPLELAHLNFHVSSTAQDGTLTLHPDSTYEGLGRLVDFNLGTTQNLTITPLDTTVTVVTDAPPVVDLNGAAAGLNYATTFTEGTSPVTIADSSNATVTDADNTTLASMTLTVGSAPDGASEALTVGGTQFPMNVNKTATGTAGGTTFNVAFVASTGTFTITKSGGGAAPIGDFQTLLRGVTYQDNTQNPTGGTRTITVVANDGTANSLVATSTVTVVPVDNPPVLGGMPGTPLSYPQGSSATVVAGGITVADPDNVTLAGATVSVSANFVAGEDVLAANVTGTGITASYNSTTGVLTLSGSDTLADYQSVLQSVTYQDLNAPPTPQTRTVTFTANDGVLTSNPVSRNVTIVATTSFSNLVVPSYTYGGASITLSGTVSAGSFYPPIGSSSIVSVTLNGAVHSNVTIGSSGQFTTQFLSSEFGSNPLAVSHGPYTISYAYAGSENFSSASTTQSLTVNKAALTVTANSVHKTYGQVNPAFTVSYSGFVNNDTSAALGGTLGFTTSATQYSDVQAGGYAVTPGGLTSGDYAISFIAGTLTIDQAAQTIAWATPSSIVYGTALSGTQLDATASGVSGGAAAGSLTYSPLSGTVLHAGTHQALTVTASPTTDYTQATATVYIDVTAAALSVTANSVHKTYGQVNPAFTVSYSGFVNNDTSAALGGTLGFTTSATQYSDVQAGGYAVTPGGLTSGDYTISFIAGTLTIDQAAQTIAWATPSSIVYGTALSGTQLDATASGVSGGAAAGSLTYSPLSGTVLHAGTHQALTVTALPTTDYTQATATVYIDVTAAALSVTANSVHKTYGQVNPAFTVSYSGFVNNDTSAALGGTLSFATSATQYSDVQAGGYAVTPGGLTSGDYTISFIAGTLTIDQAAQTIAWTTPSSIVYGTALSGTQLDATALGVSGGAAAGSLTYSPLSGTVLHAGTHQALTVTASPTTDYTQATATVYIDVTAAALSVTANSVHKTYGQVNPAFTVSYSGFVNNDTSAALGGTLGFTTSATQYSDVQAGGYAVTPGGLTSGDYAISFIAGTLTIDQAAQTIAWTTPSSIVYGTALSGTQLDATASGVAGGAAAGSLTYSPLSGTVLHAGTHQALTVTAALTTDYTQATATVYIDVTAAALSVTANSVHKTYGQVNPAFTVSYSGFVNNDTSAALGGTLGFATSATQYSDVQAGGYAVTPGGLTSGDYAISFIAGTLTIDQAAQTIAWTTPSSIVYGTALSGTQLDATASGVSGGAAAGSLTYSPLSGTVLHAGTHQALTVTASSTTDYTQATATVYIDVTAAALSVTANSVHKTYGQVNPAFTVSYSGFVNNDTSAALGGTLGFTTSATQYSDVQAGGYAVTPGGLTSGDYAISFIAGTLTIDQAAQTIAWTTPSSIVYGTALSGTQLDATASGVSGGAAAGSLTYSPLSGTVLHAGTHQALTVTAASTTDYTQATATVYIDVTAAALSVTANSVHKTYGQVNPAFTVSYSGFVNNDTSAALGGTLGFTTSATQYSDVQAGGYAVTPGGLTSGDYAISFIAGTLTIDQAAQTIAWATPSSIVYGTALSGTQLDATASGVSGGAAAGSLTYSPLSGTVLHAGTHQALTVTAASTTDYTQATATVYIDVTAAALSVTANSVHKTYGQVNPAFTVSYSGFVNNDTSAALGGTLGFATSATQYSDVQAGGYAVTPGGLTSGDYTISFIAGTLTIDQAAQTIAWTTPSSIVYGTALSGTQLDATASGVSGGAAAGSLTYSPLSGTVLHAGTHQALTVTASPTTDYTQATATVYIDVTAAALSVTANSVHKTYGQVNPAFTVSYSGFVNNDTSAALGGTLGFTTSATQYSDVQAGGYAVTPGGLTSGDYAISFIAGTLTIDQAAQTIAWTTPSSIVYGTALEWDAVGCHGVGRVRWCGGGESDVQSAVGHGAARGNAPGVDGDGGVHHGLYAGHGHGLHRRDGGGVVGDRQQRPQDLRAGEPGVHGELQRVCQQRYVGGPGRDAGLHHQCHAVQRRAGGRLRGDAGRSDLRRLRDQFHCRDVDHRPGRPDHRLDHAVKHRLRDGAEWDAVGCHGVGRVRWCGGGESDVQSAVGHGAARGNAPGVDGDGGVHHGLYAGHGHGLHRRDGGGVVGDRQQRAQDLRAGEPGVHGELQRVCQ